MLYCFPLVTLNCKEKRPMLGYRKSLMPSPTEKITIKNLHLSTHNKRNIFINISTLARLARTYKSTP